MLIDAANPVWALNVNIHDAAAAMGTIVACGDLKKK